MEHIVIIGGGGTGAALAHDLKLRGFEVSLFERGEFLSGTTGRHHGLLHSGARYAVHDPVAARECIQENKIFCLPAFIQFLFNFFCGLMMAGNSKEPLLKAGAGTPFFNSGKS